MPFYASSSVEMQFIFGVNTHSDYFMCNMLGVYYEIRHTSWNLITAPLYYDVLMYVQMFCYDVFKINKK